VRLQSPNPPFFLPKTTVHITKLTMSHNSKGHAFFLKKQKDLFFF
jgi:hypothetical protein